MSVNNKIMLEILYFWILGIWDFRDFKGPARIELGRQLLEENKTRMVHDPFIFAGKLS